MVVKIHSFELENMKKLLQKSLFFIGLAFASAVPAAVTVTISESGPNVVMNVSGSLNTTGLTGPVAEPTLCFSNNNPSGAVLTVGNDNTSCIRYYSSTNSLSAFGSGGSSGVPDSSSGYFAAAFGGYIYLPAGFVSGDAVSATSTLLNKSISSLGYTPGTYAVSLPNDSITLIIQAPTPASIPTLGEWAMIFMASLMAMFGIRRMRRSK
jgi:hypothetical protein